MSGVNHPGSEDEHGARLLPIGTVRSPRKQLDDDNWGDVPAVIELMADFGPESLAGLEAFSHAEIFFLCHRVPEAAIVRGARHPRGNPDWPKVGIFAQRGKDRPNRLGATIVRVMRVEGRNLHVIGLDAVDGTPVLDIKPVMAEFLPRQATHQPEWATALMRDYWGAAEGIVAGHAPDRPGDRVPADLVITLEPGSSLTDIEAVSQGLTAYNLQFAPDDGYEPLHLFLRMPDRTVVGGLLGETYWGWLHIRILWLHEACRGQGYGSQLLAMAEAEAARRGCRGVHLDTLSFQALPFYLAHGYQVFGVLEDHPAGHTRYYLARTSLQQP